MSEIRVPFYNHLREYHKIKAEVDAIITNSFTADYFSICSKVIVFESRLARYLGLRKCVTIDSSSDARGFALKALDIGEGDEVITTMLPFSGTAEAVRLVGATPIFVDCEPDAWTINPKLIEEKITPHTKAIFPTHTYGHPADMSAISEIAKKHNLLVIEDCDQAIGAYSDSFKIGELSDAVCVSHVAERNVSTSGDAGSVATNREQLASALCNIRNYGSLKYLEETRTRPAMVHSAIWRVKLKFIDEWSTLRIARAREYTELLADTGIRLPSERQRYHHVFSLYVIETQERDDLQKFLKERGIATMTNYPADVLIEARFPDGPGDPNVNLPITEKHAARCLALPIYPELTSDEVKIVADAIKEWLATRRL